MELARTVHASHGGLTLLDARELVNSMFEALEEGLSRDGHVVISGFGTFRVVRRRERRGWDIGRGCPVHVPSRNEVVFIPSRR